MGKVFLDRTGAEYKVRRFNPDLYTISVGWGRDVDNRGGVSLGLYPSKAEAQSALDDMAAAGGWKEEAK